MGSKLVFYQLETDKSMDEVKQAAVRAFTMLGGQVKPFGAGLQIIEGKNGVQFGFAADFDALFTINESKPGKYDLSCAVNWKMNTTTIICLVVGIFVFGILWIIPLLYLFIDPSQVYQTTLMSIKSYL